MTVRKRLSRASAGVLVSAVAYGLAAGAPTARAATPAPPPTTAPVRIAVRAPGGQPAALSGNVVVFAQGSGRREKAAFVGLTCTAADATLRDQLKLPRGVGLTVHAVEDASPAAAAGVKPHDVLVKVDDQWVINEAQLGVLVRMHKPGETVALSIVRQGDPQTVKATLAEKDVFISDAEVGDPFTGGMRVTAPLAIPSIPPVPPVPEIPGVPEIPNVMLSGREVVVDGRVVATLPAAAIGTTRPSAAGLLLPAASIAVSDPDVFIQENGRTFVIRPERGVLQLLTVTDAAGKVVFTGPIDTPEQRKTMPADVAAMLTKYEPEIQSVSGGGPSVRRRVMIIHADR